MELYAALDVSLEKTSVCVLDRDGRTVLETVVASEPQGFRQVSRHRPSLTRAGLTIWPALTTAGRMGCGA